LRQNRLGIWLTAARNGPAHSHPLFRAISRNPSRRLLILRAPAAARCRGYFLRCSGYHRDLVFLAESPPNVFCSESLGRRSNLNRPRWRFGPGCLTGDGRGRVRFLLHENLLELLHGLVHGVFTAHQRCGHHGRALSSLLTCSGRWLAMLPLVKYCRER
jgi:hypothetical protein